MRAQRWIAVGVVTGLMSLAACGDPGPQVLRGSIAGREYDDPDSWTTQSCSMYIMINKVMTCVAWQTNHHSDGPHWEFQLECAYASDKVARSWVEVREDEYDSYDLRQMYPDEGPCLTDAKDGEME